MKNHLGWDTTNREFVLWEHGHNGPLTYISVKDARGMMATIQHVLEVQGPVVQASSEWEAWKAGDDQDVETALLVYSTIHAASREQRTPDEMQEILRIRDEMLVIFGVDESYMVSEIQTRVEIDKLTNEWALIEAHAQDAMFAQAASSHLHKVQRLTSREPDSQVLIHDLLAKVAKAALGSDIGPATIAYDGSMSAALQRYQLGTQPNPHAVDLVSLFGASNDNPDPVSGMPTDDPPVDLSALVAQEPHFPDPAQPEEEHGPRCECPLCEVVYANERRR